MQMEDLPAAGQSAHGTVAGPAGDLECMVAVPRGPVRGVAVACHPHPLYGGAMSNKVVYTLASTALAQGLVSARFNFRGVGQSQGTHDSARGETDDCLAIVEWLRTRLPGQPLLLSGFSFGAFVSLQAAAGAKAAALVSIAPPFGRYFGDAPQPPHPGCPWLVLHSRDDDTVSFEETAAILETYDPPPTRVTVDGAGHFFHGRLDEVRNAMQSFLQDHWT
ncbi:MAG: alpha/beta hydrolase [Panacagrimonas sp.]